MTPRALVLGGAEPAGPVAPKAARLHDTARAGLPVPRGAIVPEEAAARLRRCATRDPRSRLAAAGLVASGGPVAGGLVAAPARVAVRSAFEGEDAEGSAQAGRYTSLLDVDGADPAALLAAIETVRASGGGQGRASGGGRVRACGGGDAPPRRDVLLLAMVPARHAGVAATETDHLDDVVAWTDGLADRLLAGRVTGRRLLLERLEPLERPRVPAGAPPFAARLARLLRRVRLVLGRGDWDVEWADDGQTCWLLQVRPLTRGIVRDEVLTVANHKEILPALPSAFMTSLIADTAPRLFGYYRAADATLPAGRPFVEVVAGRPFLNRSLLRDLLRHLGLPTRLVTDAMGGAAGLDEPDVGPRPVRLARKLPALARLGVRQLGVTGSARRTGALLRRAAAPRPASFREAVAVAEACYAGLVTEMFGLANAMSLPVAALARAGVLAELGREGRSAATRMATDLDDLRALVATRPGAAEALRGGALPDDPEVRAGWSRYLAAHGHRGIYESDLARPRFAEDPAALLAVAATPPREPASAPRRSWRARALAPLWRAARGTIATRERLRSEAMTAFADLRAGLLALAATAEADGRLPRAEDLWLLAVDEARALDDGWRLAPAEAARRREERARLAGYRFPEVFRRSDDPERFRTGGVDPRPPRTRLRGRSLTRGEVEGVAWRRDEPATAPPTRADGSAVVLVAPSVDAGWVPTFAHCAAVVVETGGDLSHGSIVLRELGLPAVTAVDGATSAIADGDRVRVRADVGVVERLGVA
ncbi:MAG: PEP-utilizing enzyme [Egibacteraceae bacterium]